MNAVNSSALISVKRPTAFFPGIAAAFKEIHASRWLLSLLVTREIKARYKNSYLGIIWSLLRPIVQLVIYYVFIGQILGAARSTPGFAIFIFGNLTIWTLFTDIVSGCTSSIVANAGLVKKVYLPREIFPLAAVGTAFFNFFIQLIVLLSATALLGAFPLTFNIFRIIPAVILISTFGLAIGLVLGAVNVYLRDVEHLVEVMLMVLFWASPVLYSFQFVQHAIGGSWLETLYLANPATLAVLQMQHGVWIAGINSSTKFWPENLDILTLIAFGASIILLVMSQRIFARMQGNFAQEL